MEHRVEIDHDDGSDQFFSPMTTPRQLALLDYAVRSAWLRFVEAVEATDFNEVQEEASDDIEHSFKPPLGSYLPQLLLEGLMAISSPQELRTVVEWLQDRMRLAVDRDAGKWVWVADKLLGFKVADANRWDESVEAAIDDLRAEATARSSSASGDDTHATVWIQLAGLLRQTTRIFSRSSESEPSTATVDTSDVTDESSIAMEKPRVATSMRPVELVSSFVSQWFSTVEDSFLCQICHEQVPATIASIKLASCGHRFCTACLRDYLRFNIQEGETSFKCFFVTSTSVSATDIACHASILDREVRQLVDNATWTKLERFKFNRQHKHARQCPYCDHSQVFANGDLIRDCQCDQCGREFCFLHSNAHVGETCSAYERRHKKAEKLNQAVIDRICKACPGCGTLIEKIEGCNQMKCASCKTSFCWLCREVIEDTTFPEHFQWWNLKGCAGEQMMGSDGPSSSCGRGCSLLVRLLFFVVVGPPAFVIAVTLSLLCCCCYPCTQICNIGYRKAFTNCLWLSGYLVLSPLILTMLIICLPCICFGWEDASRQEATPPLRPPPTVEAAARR